MHPLSITQNIKKIILGALCFLIPFSICFSVDWGNNRIHESNGDWAQKAYYDVLTISDAAKQYHQKYGEYPETVKELGMGKKIGQSYDEPLMPYRYEIDPWGNEYKISHTDSQILVYSTAGEEGLELSAANPPADAADTKAIYRLTTLSD